MEVTVKEQALQTDLRRLNQAVFDLAKRFGLPLEKVTRRQMGLWCRALMDISPPRTAQDRAKTLSSIETVTLARFGSLTSPRTAYDESMQEYGGKTGTGDVIWMRATPNSLFGVAESLDMRKATVDQIIKLRNTVTKGGNIKVGKRGKQSIFLMRKILTSKRTVNKAIQIIKGHVGRFKSYWVPGWEACGKPGRLLPHLISKHLQDLHVYKFGSVKDELANPNSPAITVVNRGPGAGNMLKRSGWLMRVAAQARLHALETRIKILVEHPERINEEVGDDN